MPTKVKILIRRAKNLPIMDRKTKLTDAYVEVRLGTSYYEKTPVQPHTLNPVWKKAITFQVTDDRTLITDPVEIKILDKDVVSDDIIGVVYLDLSTLLYPRPQMSLSNPALSSPRSTAISPNSVMNPRSVGSDRKLGKDAQFQPSSGSGGNGMSLSASMSAGISIPSSAKKTSIFTPPKTPGSLLLRNVRRDGSGAASGEDASCCSDHDEADGSSAASGAASVGSAIEADSAKISGWFPIYDTLKGVQGEINLSVEVRNIENMDPLAGPSVGVQFFSTSLPPHIERVAGLVGACKIEDDPEYQWADTFRLSRTSNEVRQVLMYKLAGKLRKKISTQVRALGCNAVIGYRQCIELEGTMGLVARGYGTAAVVIPYAESAETESCPSLNQEQNDLFHSPPAQPNDMCGSSPGVQGMLTASAPWSFGPTSSQQSGLGGLNSPLQQSQAQAQVQQPQMPQQQSQSQQQQQAQVQKIPLLTVTSLEKGAIQHVGGVVISRMVRLMKKTDSGNSKIRSKWWEEIRNEVRRHANSLGCTHVIGYVEEVAAQDFEELTVMSGVGTAVTISPEFAAKYSSPITTPTFKYRPGDSVHPCRACHVPYARTSKLPFKTQLTRCCICGRKYVPEMILSTAEIPAGVAVVGAGEFIQARTVLPRKHGVGKAAANSISSALPFLEYELHRQLTIKLGIMGMNAVFALNYELEIGMNSVVGVATGTAVYLRALPPPMLSFKREDDPLKKTYEFNAERIKSLIADDKYSHPVIQKSVSEFSLSSITPKRSTKAAPIVLSRTSSAQKISSHSTLLSRPTVVHQASSSDNDEFDDNEDGIAIITTTATTETEPRKKSKPSGRRKELSSSTNKHKKKKKSKAKSTKTKHKKGSDQSGNTSSSGNSDDDDDSSSSSSDSDSSSEAEGCLSGKGSFKGSTNEGVNSGDFGADDDEHGKVLESPDIKATMLNFVDDYPCSSPEMEADVPVFLGALKQPYVLSLPELIENDSGMHDDRYVPQNVHLCTTETLPGNWILGKDSKLVVLARRTHWRSHFSMRSLELERTLDDVISSAVFNSCRDSTPYCISALKVRVDMVESRDAQVVLTAVCTPLMDADSASSSGSSDTHMFQLDDALPSSANGLSSGRSGSATVSHGSHGHQQQQQNPQGVIITALTNLPHKVITRYLGFVNMHIVRESFNLSNELGKEGFTTDIFVDMFAILRARVSAMNGNALIGFNMNIFHFKSSTQKDQGYCLISLTGDAVKYRDV